MTTQEASLKAPISDESIYHRLESYPFDSDLEFQSGLSSILSSNQTQDPSLLVLRARCFYFSRKHSISIDFEAYKQWRLSRDLPLVTVPAPSRPLEATGSSRIAPKDNNTLSTTNDAQQNAQNEQQPQAPYPNSFSQIVDLITKGEPIPGIKDVPDTLLTGQESVATTAKRKKPWETDQAREEKQEPTIGTSG
ncbi:MAG: hypothetical protein Q9183_002077 [Haloplaca sp. 2 TL-2023]